MKRVDCFKYLGGYVTKDCKVYVEITGRILAASCAIRRLREMVFDDRDLTVETNLKVSVQSVRHPSNDLWYGETCTLYRPHQIKLIRAVQQRNLRIFFISDVITSSFFLSL